MSPVRFYFSLDGIDPSLAIFAGRHLQSFLGCCHRLGKLTTFRISSGQSAKDHCIFAARQLHGLLGDLDSAIPIS